MALFKRGRFWHYEFQINGTRYRGSTKQNTETRARQIQVRKMQEAQENVFLRYRRKTDSPRFCCCRAQNHRRKLARLRHQAILPKRLEPTCGHAPGRHEVGSNNNRSRRGDQPRWFPVLAESSASDFKRHLGEGGTASLSERLKADNQADKRESRREPLIDDEAEAALLAVSGKRLRHVLVSCATWGCDPTRCSA